MAQEFNLDLKDSKYPLCTECKNTLPHCHCKCPYCGNPECVCDFSKHEGR